MSPALSPAALAFPPLLADAESGPLGQPFFLCFGPGSPLPSLPASLPPFPGLVSVGRRRSGPGFLYYQAYKRAAWVKRTQPQVLLQTRSVSGTGSLSTLGSSFLLRSPLRFTLKREGKSIRLPGFVRERPSVFLCFCSQRKKKSGHCVCVPLASLR